MKWQVESKGGREEGEREEGRVAAPWAFVLYLPPGLKVASQPLMRVHRRGEGGRILDMQFFLESWERMFIKRDFSVFPATDARFSSDPTEEITEKFKHFIREMK